MQTPARSRRTPPPLAAEQDRALPVADRLLRWFDTAGRHDLPWQHPRSPYRVWLSEIMLQQTQVQVVIPYFLRFLDALPSLPALAAVPLDRVLALWTGLGYYARARNLRAAAQACVERHGGELPRDMQALTALPGIGRSTAAAIASQAWGAHEPILDGNVKRVLARYYGIAGWPGLPAVERRLWALAEMQLAVAGLPAARMPDYTQAQMDLGATVCTRANPACILCPLQDGCVARIEGRTAELPTPRPGKVLPRRTATVLWLEDADGRVLLQRRPPVGVWASLWSLPQFDDERSALEWMAAHADGSGPDAVTLEPVEHGFSHYLLRLQPLHRRGVTLRGGVQDNEDLRWVPRDGFGTLGMPGRMRRLLEQPPRTTS